MGGSVGLGGRKRSLRFLDEGDERLKKKSKVDVEEKNSGGGDGSSKVWVFFNLVYDLFLFCFLSFFIILIYFFIFYRIEILS